MLQESTLNQVFEILKPLSESFGEHSYSVRFYSPSSGVIEFMIHWKCFTGELEFNSQSELLEKAGELLNMANQKRKL